MGPSMACHKISNLVPANDKNSKGSVMQGHKKQNTKYK